MSSVSILLILPLFSDIATPTLVSSRKLHAGNCRGEEGSASDTRRCCLCGVSSLVTSDEDGAGWGWWKDDAVPVKAKEAEVEVEVETGCAACRKGLPPLDRVCRSRGQSRARLQSCWVHERAAVEQIARQLTRHQSEQWT